MEKQNTSPWCREAGAPNSNNNHFFCYLQSLGTKQNKTILNSSPLGWRDLQGCSKRQGKQGSFSASATAKKRNGKLANNNNNKNNKSTRLKARKKAEPRPVKRTSSLDGLWTASHCVVKAEPSPVKLSADGLIPPYCAHSKNASESCGCKGPRRSQRQV